MKFSKPRRICPAAKTCTQRLPTIARSVFSCRCLALRAQVVVVLIIERGPVEAAQVRQPGLDVRRRGGLLQRVVAGVEVVGAGRADGDDGAVVRQQFDPAAGGLPQVGPRGHLAGASRPSASTASSAAARSAAATRRRPTQSSTSGSTFAIICERS